MGSVVEDGLEKGLKINFHGWVGGWGWVAGSSGIKAISAFNSVEVEAELGNQLILLISVDKDCNCFTKQCFAVHLFHPFWQFLLFKYGK